MRSISRGLSAFVPPEATDIPGGALNYLMSFLPLTYSKSEFNTRFPVQLFVADVFFCFADGAIKFPTTSFQ